MHASTEDLFTVRDGEPIDAKTQAEIGATPAHAREIERLRRVQQALGDLPELAPPPGVWDRVLARQRATRYRSAAWLRWVAGAATAAAVAAGAIIYVAGSERLAVEPERGTTVADGVRHDPLNGPIVPASYVSLVEESERLERILSRVPRQKLVMSGRTASTIVGLEDRIAFIDEQLSYGAARGSQIPEREALWGERVELMNALVHVRYAQAEGPGF